MSMEIRCSPYGEFVILFAEKFKSKINIYFLFQNQHFRHDFYFVRSLPISNIWNLKKGAYLNFAMVAILHKQATVFMVEFWACVHAVQVM